MPRDASYRKIRTIYWFIFSNHLLIPLRCPAKAFPPEARDMTARASHYPGDTSVDLCMDGRDIKSVLNFLLF